MSARVVVDKPVYLVAQNSGWLKASVEVNELRMVLKRRHPVTIGPFRPGQAVSYGGDSAVDFRFVEAP